jgi:amidase
MVGTGWRGPHVNALPSSIEALHRSVELGEYTFSDVVRTTLRRIDAVDPLVGALISVNPRALDEAEALDGELRRTGRLRPLHGVTVTVKDNIDTDDLPTTGGSLAFKDRRPKVDADVVRHLRCAGAIIISKANLHELARGKTTRSSLGGQTKNPWDLRYTPGGSSGGTAVAVACGLALAGVGTDTGQSVRSPASATSLVGYRPSRGLISRSGVIPVSRTRDAVGPICLTVDDARAVADVLSGGRLSSDARWQGVHARSALAVSSVDDLTAGDGELASRYREVIDILRGAGIDVRSTVLGDPERIRQRTESIIPFEWPREFAAFFRDDSGPWPKTLEGVLASGHFDETLREPLVQSVHHRPSMLSYLLARQAARGLALRLRMMMRSTGVDVLMFPHQTESVARIGEPQVGRNGFIASLTGLPSIVVPMPALAGRDDHGLPILPSGVELVGRPGFDRSLFDAAKVVETTLRAATPTGRRFIVPCNVPTSVEDRPQRGS